MIKHPAGITRIVIIILVLIGIGIALYLVQNPQIFSPKAAESNYSMGVGPQPCFIQGGKNTCTATISWKAYTSQPVKIIVRETGGLFATGAFGSQDAPWISATPIHFDMYVGNNVVMSTEAFGSTTLPTVYITASPNPCVLNGATCTSTISWKYDAPVEIRIKENPGSVFAKGAASGSQAAPWIGASGATFQVFANNVKFDELFVQGVASGSPAPSPSSSASPSPSSSPSPSTSPSPLPSPSLLPRRISATPNPCNLNGATTCTSAISWSYDSVVEIRIKEVPGSLFAKSKSGTQSAPWISASGATFQVYSNNIFVEELFVRGTGPSSSPSVNVGSTNGLITANPNPCSITSGSQTCTSTIIWNAGSRTDVKIRIREVPGSLFASGTYGTQSAPWISSTGATFDLYSGNTLIDTLVVKGIGPIPSVSPSGSAKKGDLNNDGQIDVLDYNIFLQDYANNNLRSDLNNSGQVDVLDYNILIQNFGT